MDTSTLPALSSEAASGSEAAEAQTQIHELLIRIEACRHRRAQSQDAQEKIRLTEAIGEASQRIWRLRRNGTSGR